MHLILGSQSPQRKEILSFFSVPFTQVSPHFAEEQVPVGEDPAAYAQTLAMGKAASLSLTYPNAPILTADTCVWKNGRILGKPADKDEALAMLQMLNGSWHSVYTAVTARLGGKEITAYEETRVLFHKVSQDQLRRYHQAFLGADKAGGYSVQKGGSIIIKRLEGCFYNVMGLPITASCQVLSKVGINLWHYLDLR